MSLYGNVVYVFGFFLFLLLKDVISISTIYKVCSPALRATHGIRGGHLQS